MSENSNLDETGSETPATSDRPDKIAMEKRKQAVVEGSALDDTSRESEAELPRATRRPKSRSLSVFLLEDLEQAVKDQDEKIAKRLAQERQQSGDSSDAH